MKRRRRATRTQPRHPGRHRVPTWGSLHPAVRAAVEREAAAHGVSRSWVLNVNMAIALGIDLDERDRYDR